MEPNHPEAADPRLDALFDALANHLRRSILLRLASGAVTVGELAEMSGVSMPAISRHLRQLEQAGLLARTKRGRHHVVDLRPGPLAEVLRWLHRFPVVEAAAEPAGKRAPKVKKQPAEALAPEPGSRAEAAEGEQLDRESLAEYLQRLRGRKG